jgi:hypothetical protein
MDSMPILHANRVFTIHIEDDLAFTEVRAVLDHLLERQAFALQGEDSQNSYLIDLEAASFEVWVWELDVVIRRR